MDTIKKIRGVSDEVKEKKLMQVLQSLDTDKDGKIDDINDVLKVNRFFKRELYNNQLEIFIYIVKVFDLIEQDNVKVSKKQLGKILSILEKEKLIELEEEKAEASAKETKADKQQINKLTLFFVGLKFQFKYFLKRKEYFILIPDTQYYLIKIYRLI